MIHLHSLPLEPSPSLFSDPGPPCLQAHFNLGPYTGHSPPPWAGYPSASPLPKLNFSIGPFFSTLCSRPLPLSSTPKSLNPVHSIFPNAFILACYIFVLIIANCLYPPQECVSYRDRNLPCSLMNSKEPTTVTEAEMCSINTCLLRRPLHGHRRPGAGKGPTLPGTLYTQGTVEGAFQTLYTPGRLRASSAYVEGSLGYQVIRLGSCRHGSQAAPSPPARRASAAVSWEARCPLQHSLWPSHLTPNIYQQGRPHSDCWAGTCRIHLWGGCAL